MKKIAVLITILYGQATIAQKPLSARDTTEYYIDSIRISSLNFLDHSKIEKAHLVKADGKKNRHNKVFVSIKKSAQLQWLTISDIMQQNKLTDSAAYLLMLNDNLINDTASFRIDADLVKSVAILKGSEIETIPNNLPNAAMLKLFTGSKENLEKTTIIRIKNY